MEHAGTVAPSLAAAQQHGSGVVVGVGSSQANAEVAVAGELAGALAAEEDDNPPRGRCREVKPAAASGLHHARRLGNLPHSAASALCLAKMRAQSPPRSSSDDSLMRHTEGGAIPLGAPGSSGGDGVGRDNEEDGMLLSRNGLVADEEKMRSASYEAWTDKHPSALLHFEHLVSVVAGRQLALFLDYDGTLAPIVEDPEKAFMSDAMRAAVKEAASLFPTAIISGRGREKVFQFVKLSELYYAGSHGMDIMLPARPPLALNHASATASASASGGGVDADAAREGVEDVARTLVSDPHMQGERVMLCQPATDFLPVMKEVFERLSARAASIPGALVENNKFCVTVHFRRVPEQFWEELADAVVDEVKDYPTLRTSHGRKVLEVRPVLDWDKGKAVSYLLQALGLGDATSTMPLYIGDDRTDEDAFQVLRDRGSGCGIIVSAAEKTTLASYSLRDPSEVMTFLHRLVEWKGPLRGELQGCIFPQS